MSKTQAKNNNGLTFMQVSKRFRDWINSRKVHERQPNHEVCDEIMDICKQKGVLEGK